MRALELVAGMAVTTAAAFVFLNALADLPALVSWAVRCIRYINGGDDQ